MRENRVSGGPMARPIVFEAAGNGYQGLGRRPDGNILVAWLQQINMNLN
jgi:hypothetical protein